MHLVQIMILIESQPGNTFQKPTGWRRTIYWACSLVKYIMKRINAHSAYLNKLRIARETFSNQTCV